MNETEVWQKFQAARDETARAWLIEHHKPLVERTLRRFHGVRSADREDLRGAGYYGLCKAVDTWDPARMPWERFASHTIYYSMVNYIRDCDWVPKGIRADAKKLDEIEDILTQELQRQPTSEELAERLGVTPDELDDLKSKSRATDWNIASLDFRAETEAPWSECVPDPYAELPEEATLENEHTHALYSLLARLPERERFILEQRYLVLPRPTEKELGRLLGVHESRISQQIREALARAKELSRQRPLHLEEADSK